MFQLTQLCCIIDADRASQPLPAVSEPPVPDTANNPHVLSHKTRLAETNPPAASRDGVHAALGALVADVGQLQFVQALIQLLPHAAVFVVDAERNLVCWSDNARRLLGFQREDVLGRYCLTANRCHQCMLGCGISEYGAVTDVPLVLLHKSGAQVHVRKTARAFFDARHRFIGGVEILVADVPLHDSTDPHVAAPPRPVQPVRDPYDLSSPNQMSDVTPEASPLTTTNPVLRKLPSPRTLSDAELKLKIQEAFVRADGHIGRAAILLGVSRPTLWRWRRKLDIHIE